MNKDIIIIICGADIANFFLTCLEYDTIEQITDAEGKLTIVKLRLETFCCNKCICANQES